MMRRVLSLGWIAAATVLAGCGSGGTDPVVEEVVDDMRADQVMIEVQHVLTSDGIQRAVLNADTAYVYEDSSRVEMRMVRLRLFDERGAEAATLTSRRGRLNTQTQKMTARGDVVLVATERDRRVETEELFYDPQADEIWSDMETRLYEDGSEVRGDGFTSDGRLRNLKIRNPSGQFQGLDIEF